MNACSHHLEGTVSAESLWHWITETPSKRKTKPLTKEEQKKTMGRPKGRNTEYYRKVDLFPLWEVIDEKGKLLGSLSLQQGGKARLTLRENESGDKLPTVQHKRK